LINPNLFNWGDYSNLPIRERLSRFREVISYIRSILKAYQNIEDIQLPFLERSLGEIKKGLEILDFVVNMIDPSLTKDDIRVVETSCPDASTVYASLNNAADLLRVAIRIRRLLQKSYDDQLDLKYFGHLHACENALNNVLYNMSPLDKASP